MKFVFVLSSFFFLYATRFSLFTSNSLVEIANSNRFKNQQKDENDDLDDVDDDESFDTNC